MTHFMDTPFENPHLKSFRGSFFQITQESVYTDSLDQRIDSIDSFLDH